MKSLRNFIFGTAGVCMCICGTAVLLGGCDRDNQESRGNGERPAYYIIRDELDGGRTADKVNEILEQQPAAEQDTQAP